MENKLHQLAAAAQQTEIMPQQLLYDLNQLTHAYKNSYDTSKFQAVNSAWTIIENSHNFWPNIEYLLNAAHYIETRFQAFNCIEKRVRTNWMEQASQTREELKKYLCRQSLTYISQINNNPQTSIIFRKINNILVEIIKYQWSSSWVNFFTDLCQSILANPIQSQNPLDLLSHILEQLFSDQQKLTTYQVQKLNNLFTKQFKYIERIIESCLVPGYPPKVVINCLKVVQNCLPWVPSYYIYSSLSMHIIVEMAKNQQYIDNVLDCIFEVYKTKLHESYKFQGFTHKRKHLLALSEYIASASPADQIDKFLKIAGDVLKEDQQFSQKPEHEEEMYKNPKYKQQNLYLCRKIFQLLEFSQSPLQHIELYGVLGNNSHPDDLYQVVSHMIDLTPCPISTPFFYKNNIIKEENSFCWENDEDYYRQFSKVVRCFSQNYKNYAQILIQKILGSIKTLQQIRKFCGATWNFYFLMDWLPNNMFCSNFVQLMVPLIRIYRQIALQMNSQKQKINNTNRKKLLAYRSSIIILYLHPRALSFRIVKNHISSFMKQLFREEEELIKIGISTMIKSLSYMKFKQRTELINVTITQNLVNHMKNYQINCFVLDQIQQWAKSHKKMPVIDSLIPEKDSSIQIYEILKEYRNALTSINRSSVVQINQFIQMKRIILKQGKKFMNLFAKAIHMILSSLSHMNEQSMSSYCERILTDINLCKKIVTYCLSSSYSQEQSQYQSFEQFSIQYSYNFLIPYMEFYINYFNKMNENSIIMQLIKHQNDILQPIRNTIDIMIEVNQHCSMFMENQQIVCIRQKCLYFLGLMIEKIKHFNFNPLVYINTVKSIVSEVQNMSLPAQTPGYTEILKSLVNFNFLNCLQRQCINGIINKIFKLAADQNQNLNQSAFKLMNTLISMALVEQRNQSNSYIQEHLISFIAYTYKQMIMFPRSVTCNTKNHHQIRFSKNDEKVNNYIEVLYYSIMEVRKRDWKFDKNQISDNVSEIIYQLQIILLQVYPNLPKSMSEKLLNGLKTIFQHSQLSHFKQGMKDYLIILHRGF